MLQEMQALTSPVKKKQKKLLRVWLDPCEIIAELRLLFIAFAKRTSALVET